MVEGTLNQALVEKKDSTRREKGHLRTYSFGPWLSCIVFITVIHVLVLFVLVSVVGCGLSLKNVAGRYSSRCSAILGVDVTNIFHFMFTYSEGDSMKAKGVLWRVVMMYGFFIFGGLMGLLNCIPSVRKGLDKKTLISFCSSY